MSNDPHKSAPFSAHTLDKLDLPKRTGNFSTEITPGSAVSRPPPPSFSSFPDIAIPKFSAAPPTVTSAGSGSTVSAAPPFAIPSFSSFPIDTRPPPSPPVPAATAPVKERKNKKDKRESRSNDRRRDEEREKGQESGRKGQSKDDKRHDDDRISTHRKEKRKSRSSSREDHRRSHKDDRRFRDAERDSERDKTRDRDRDRNREGHRDKDRHSYRDKEKGKEKDRDRDRDKDRTYSDHHRDDDRSSRKSARESSRERYSSSRSLSTRTTSTQRERSPDRKKARVIPEGEQQNIGWKQRRDRDIKEEQDRKPSPNVAAGFVSDARRATINAGKAMGSNNNNNKHKPGEWVFDVTGDQEIFRYGLNPYIVPLYSRAGAGRVMGLSNSLRIDYEKTRAIGNRGLVMRQGGMGAKSTRYSDPNATWRDQSQEFKRITRANAEELASKLNLEQEDPSFISLDIRLGSKKRRSLEDSGDEDDDDNEYDRRAGGSSNPRKTANYRDIHGKSVYKDEDEDLLQTTNDQEEEGAESALDVLMRRRMMLDGDLRKAPKQPEKWLEFVAVEDAIDLVTNRRSASSVAAHSGSHAEIRLSILERALQSNPTNEYLLLEYMDTCRLCWVPAKVLTKWDELLQSDRILTAWPGLWIEYLDFRQRHFLSFSVKNFIRVLQDALDRLGQLANSTRKTLQRVSDKAELKCHLVKVELVMVHVLSRAWTFLKQAGYIERAQGSLQGQVEFLFNMPSSLLSESWQIQIRSLEEFWDSELPRFGEKGAKGWAHYVTEDDEVEMEYLLQQVGLPSKASNIDEMLKSFANNEVDRYVYTQWAKTEKELNTRCWFPIRTTEDIPEQMEDDTFGVVLFDDIRPFIIQLHTPEARLQLIDCIFNFLGLPMNTFAGSNGFRSSSSSPATTAGSGATSVKKATLTSVYNPFFHDGLLLNFGMDSQQVAFSSNAGLKRFFPEFESKKKSIERVLKELAREEQFLEPVEQDWSCVWSLPLHNFPQGIDTIFGQPYHPSGLKLSSSPYPWATVSTHEETQQSNKLFIRNTFEQFIQVTPLDKAHRQSLSIYHLMYEGLETLSGSKAQKLAKKYLSGDRMDLVLWNGLAQAEKSQGRIPESRKVYSTALSMYPSFQIEHQTRAPLIHRYYAQLEWEQGRPRAALLVLMALADKAPLNLPADDKEDASMPSPTRLLICRQKYAEEVARLNLVRQSIQTTDASTTTPTGSKWIESALDWIVCYAWFEYLSAGPGVGVAPAIKVFENAIQELDFRNPDAEIVVTAAVSTAVGRKDQSKGGSKIYSSALLTSLSDDLGLDSLTAKGPPTKKKICTGPEVELVWIEMAKLVYFHSLQASQQRKSGSVGDSAAGGFQPRDLRRVVRDGLVRFPNCSILLSLFFWTEAQQRYHGRVRTWVQEQVSRRPGGSRSNSDGASTSEPSSSSLATSIPASKAPLWTLGVFYELWHQEPYNPHAVRSLLESALDSSQTTTFSSSPNLWMIYIELELRESARKREAASSSALMIQKGHKDGRGSSRESRGSSSRSHGNKSKSVLPSSSSSSSMFTDQDLETSPKVKQLLMRALNDCPWYKDLYLLAFEPRMKALFSLNELDQLYQTILEKEIRVRVEIPDRLSSSEVPKEGAPASNDSDDDDVRKESD
ncbi:MAG: NRDE-2, necessary for RNA interference-domain-containing protein [Linnemannia gamsii]|nr:MAG: NRDE-2, necessary for RNA interference-domain-containing protein [Linnemannia gamsii]